MCKIICQFSYVRAQHTVQGKHCSSTFHISSSTKWKVLTLYRSKSFFTRFFFPNLCLWPTTYLFSYHGLSRDPRSIRARLRFQPWVSGVYIYIYIYLYWYWGLNFIVSNIHEKISVYEMLKMVFLNRFVTLYYFCDKL